MQRAEFEQVLDAQITTIKDMLIGKRDEYADDEDVLHNFRNAANLTGESMEQALAGMMVKHTVSIYDMIADGEMHTLSKWDEKITDHINYLILLRAIIKEQYDKMQKMINSSEKDLVFASELSPSEVYRHTREHLGSIRS